MDSLFNPERMDPVLIEFGSSAYFEFLDARPGWGVYFALGEEVIFVEEGKAYQITTGPGGVQDLPDDFEVGGAEPLPGDSGQKSLLSWWRSICSLPLIAGLALFGLVWRR